MDYINIATQAVKKSGDVLKNSFARQSTVEGKGKHDIVTEADRASEKIILDLLHDYFPEHAIVAEESGARHTNSSYTWYVDPLDGTTNFVTGNPYFSVSLALAHEGEVVLAVVFNPILDELYVAEKDHGAFLNGQQMHVSKNRQFSEALLAAAYSMAENDIRRGLKTIEALALKARKVVINFSPALDLCNIARGRIDGLVDNGTTPEDHAAGSLILTEAGGAVQNYQSAHWNVNETGVIASNGVFQKELATIAQ